MHDVSLIIDGVAYGGWKAIRLRRSLEEFARSFSVQFYDSWTERAAVVPILKGQTVEIKVDGATKLYGYVDDLAVQYDAQSHSLDATGRSVVGDLEDCSAVVPEGKKKRRWDAGSTILKIATDICQPFSITVGGPTVSKEINEKLPRAFALERGETGREALERLAELKGLLLQSTTEGNVVFLRAGTKRVKNTVLRYGDNIKSCRYTSSDRERFSHYIFRGQSTADDSWNGQAATQIKGFAQDEEITRFRPFYVNAQVQSDKKDLGFRAIWERNTRAGRSESITYSVQGWKHADGFWAPNELVSVDDALLNIRDEMLISAVDWVASVQGGFVTELELVDKRTYDVVGTPKVARKKAQPADKQWHNVPAFVTWAGPGR